MKNKILVRYLQFIGIFQVVYWGLTHIFFPKWYLTVIAGKSPSLLTPQNLLSTNEIGVLTIGMGVATFLAARDPLKNFPVIAAVYVSALGSTSATLYHILIRQASQEWGHIVTVLVLLGILTWLYPWNKLSKSF